MSYQWEIKPKEFSPLVFHESGVLIRALTVRTSEADNVLVLDRVVAERLWKRLNLNARVGASWLERRVWWDGNSVYFRWFMYPVKAEP